ncbi:MAG: hypothetical protein HDT44_08315 [Ruminococcaceae bacterium]|nr:hypothetical protein [Oscillospiraceae bacterium]
MDIFIKREPDISLQEWIDYVKSDNDLILAEKTEGINPITKQKLVINIKGRALYGDVDIVYKDGCIGNDDFYDELPDKLKEIAQSLGAEYFEL